LTGSAPATISTFNSNQGSAVNIGLPLSTVQGWVSGSIPNYGVYLYGPKGNDYEWKRFVNSSDTTGAQKPYLSVTYTVPSVTLAAPASNAWINSPSLLQWAYNGNNGPVQQSSYHLQIATDSQFLNVVRDTGVVGGAGTTYPPSGLTSGSTYFWRVQVSDGYSWSAWASSQFRWDSSAPTNSTAPTTQTDIGTTSYTFSWTANDTESGIASQNPYGLTLKKSTSQANANTCPTSWTVVSSFPQSAASYAPSGLANGYCYELSVTVTDAVGNVSPAATSSPILVDTAGPTNLAINAAKTATVSQTSGTGTAIYFQPVTGSATRTVTISGSATASYSGIAGVTYSVPPSSGWTTSPAGSTGATLTYGPSAGADTVLSATATNHVAVPGPGTVPSSVHLIADSTGPTVDFTQAPSGAKSLAGGTLYQKDTTVKLGWNQSDGQSQVSAVAPTVTRLSAAYDPSNPGTCAGVTYGNPTSETPSVSGGNVTVTDLALSTNTCFEWKVSVADNVGNVTTVTSGMLLVDQIPPAIPTVGASGTGVYQSGASVFVNTNPQISGGSGSLKLTATSSQGTSGVGSSTFSMTPSEVTGWRLTNPVSSDPSVPSTVSGNPASATYGWTASAVSSGVSVNSTSNAGAISPVAEPVNRNETPGFGD
jgi:hypothetical protein